MKKVIVALVVIVAALSTAAPAVSHLPVRAHMAITRLDAMDRFFHYLRGRCGLKIGPFPLWVCNGFVNSGCRLVGNQPDHPQWRCVGHVIERKGWANISGPPGRICAVGADYSPYGRRLRGVKGPCEALGPPSASDKTTKE